MNPSAQVVIVGAGIVATSTAYHLARHGCTDVVVLEQGPLPAAGGPGVPALVFQAGPSPLMTRLAASTVEQLRGLELDGWPCYDPVGGIEIAASAARWQDLHRTQGLASCSGVRAELLTPSAVAHRFPQLDPARIHGGLHVPADGVAEPVRVVAAMAHWARRLGVRREGCTEVTGFDVRGGQVRAVRTSRGRIATQAVVCAAGIRGPRVGRLAGVSVPVQPMVHQYAVTTPVPALDGAGPEVVQPILHDQDRSLYVRQVRDRIGIGSYQPGRVPLGFDHARDGAGKLVPSLHQTALAKKVSCLLACTGDGMPLLGPAAELPNFWLAEAVGCAQGPGVGKVMAEWLLGGEAPIDVGGIIGGIRPLEAIRGGDRRVGTRISGAAYPARIGRLRLPL